MEKDDSYWFLGQCRNIDYTPDYAVECKLSADGAKQYGADANKL